MNLPLPLDQFVYYIEEGHGSDIRLFKINYDVKFSIVVRLLIWIVKMHKSY